MSRIGRALAHAVIRAYPRAWRERYETEIHELVDETDARLPDAVDLATGAIQRRLIGGAHMRFELGYRHPSAFAILALIIMAPTLAVALLSLVGHELGVGAVASVVDPLLASITAPRVIDLGLVVAPLVAFLLAALPLLDARFEQGDDGRMLALRVRALPVNLLVGAVAIILGASLIGHIITESVLQLGA